MHKIVSFRSVVVLASVCTLAGCTYGAGPIEQMAVQNMAICQATHSQQACDQYTYEAPLVQGERDRQNQENTQKAIGFAAVLSGLAGVGAAYAETH